MPRHQTTLTELARLGFAELGETHARLDELALPDLLPAFASAADANDGTSSGESSSSSRALVPPSSAKPSLASSVSVV